MPLPLYLFYDPTGRGTSFAGICGGAGACESGNTCPKGQLTGFRGEVMMSVW